MLIKETGAVLDEARRRKEEEKEKFVAAAASGNVEEALAAAKAWREASELTRAVYDLYREITELR